MAKNIYDMLNDNLINLEELEKEGFNDIEKRRIKKKFKKTIHKNEDKKNKGVAVAVAAGVLAVTLFGTNIGNEAIANIRLMASDVGNYLGISKDLSDYKTAVGKTITKDGVTIQLNEVILDKDELIVSTTLKSDTKLEEDGIIATSEDVYINGKNISSGSGGSSNQIDDYTMESVISYGLDEEIPNGDLNIKIEYGNAYIDGVEKRKGPWLFEFKTNGDQLAIETIESNIDYDFKLENGNKIILEKYTSNAVGQKIYYSVEGKGGTYDIELRGKDDLGNEVKFNLTREAYGKGIMKGSKTSDDAKTLTLTPYAVAFPKESGKMSNDFKQVGEEFTIEINK